MIHKDHAEIHTVSVELQAITVDKRQMTQSVFKQLPEENIINGETLELRGVPWGWVNYFWPATLAKLPRYATNPLHVVWQLDKYLYRSLFSTSGRCYSLSHTSQWMTSIHPLYWQPQNMHARRRS